MIKLIASDLDGTLLLNGAQSLEKQTSDIIRRIVDKNIIFAPASGRQIESLRRLFEEVDRELMYIGENGALVRYKGEYLVKTPMDYKLAMEIIQEVNELPSCEILVSGQDKAYICPKSEEYLHRMTKVVNYNTEVLTDFRQIDEDILKVAICDLSGIDNSKDFLLSRWAGQVSATVSGKLYLDYMEKSVNKGNAIKRVLDILGIREDEAMGFGDNYNDIQMLEAVGHSYVMSQAADEVKSHARYVTDRVESVLLGLL